MDEYYVCVTAVSIRNRSDVTASFRKYDVCKQNGMVECASRTIFEMAKFYDIPPRYASYVLGRGCRKFRRYKEPILMC